VVPDTGDNAAITVAGSYTVTLDDDFSPESLTFDDANGILDIGNHQLGVNISTTFIAGTITMEGGTFFVGGNGMVTSVGATLMGWGAVNDAITGSGSVVATSSHTLELVDEVTDGATHYEIQSNATLQVDDLSANNLTFSFLASTGQVTFQDNANFDQTTISGLVAGSSTDFPTANFVYLPFLAFDTVTVELVSGGVGSSGEVFVKYNMDQSKITFDLTNVVANGSNWQVEATPDGNGTIVFLAAACYCAGTLIRTPDGELSVEHLKIGDRVVTISGEAKPVKWIGRRSYSGRFIANNRAVLPICVSADALADGVPARDLWISPEHALFIDGALVPARLLVNGATITQVASVEELEYFHIELEQHDIIFAEGASAETFTDCDNRGMFQNAPNFAALYPDDRRASWQMYAPRLEATEANDLRAALLDRANRIGDWFTDDPDLYLIVDGSIIEVQSFEAGLYRFTIPAGSRTAFLASRSAVPAEVDVSSRDIRQLGVSINRIVLSSRELRIVVEHGYSGLREGFHPDEGCHRWTDGRGRLPHELLGLFADEIIVEVEVITPGWSYPMARSQSRSTLQTASGLSDFQAPLPAPNRVAAPLAIA
jgi:hypothetical protein